jgi:microcystin-dependent protein
MSVLSPSAKMQFLDITGAPLVGGLLYTYAAGTTTPLATYTDNSGISLNPNPVVLNARGEASVWLGANTYKFKLADSNNNEIWTVDNISAPTSALSPVLSGNVVINTDSSNTALTITQTGTGAVLRVQDSANPDVTPFIITNTGQVGIGTASPTTNLDVADGTIRLSTSGGVAYTDLFADATNSTLSAVNDRNLVLQTNGVTRATINSSAATFTVPIIGVGANPSGIIAPFAGSSAPSGWLICNGIAYSRTTYASLFTAIGTLWGVGDGSTTFNIPDLRGQFLRGYDSRSPTSGAVDTTVISGVTTSGSTTVSGIPSTTYLYAGMPITGTGIPASTTIVSKAANSIVISAAATATSATLSCTTNSTATVTTASTATLSVGQAVSGTGIVVGSYIYQIFNSTTFAITPAASGSGTNTLSFGTTLTVGRTLAGAQLDAYETHNHAVNDPSHAHDLGIVLAAGSGGAVPYPQTGVTPVATTNSNTTGLTVNNSYTGNVETRPKNYAVLYIIKT